MGRPVNQLAGEFLRTILPAPVVGNVCISFLDPNSEELDSGFYRFPESLEDALADVEHHADDYHAYFSPVLYQGDRRIKANVVDQVSCLWADLDDCHPQECQPEPTISVETSPGRFQAYWLLEKPVTAKEAERLNRTIAYAYRDKGCDVSGWSSNKLLRVPGTPNLKAHYEPKPVVTVISQNNKRYRPADFGHLPKPPHLFNRGDSALPPQEAVADKYVGRVTGFVDELNRRINEGRFIKSGPKGRSYSDARFNLLCSLLEIGLPTSMMSAATSGCIAFDRERNFAYDLNAALGKHDHVDLTCVQGNCPNARQDDLRITRLTTSDEDKFWTSRVELEHIRQFARAKYASPWAALGAVLARVIVSTHPSLVLPAIIGGQASLNLFVGLVGNSGDGKGAAEDVAEDAFIWPEVIEPITPGSGEGLSNLFVYRKKATAKDPTPELVQYQTKAYLTAQEIDSLAAVSKRMGSTIMPELRRAYMGEQLGFQYADPSRRLPVRKHSYRLCFVAGIQPQRAGVLMDDADGGTPQRFLWMPALEKDAPDDDVEAPEPIQWKNPFTPNGIDGDLTGAYKITNQEFAVCEAARKTIIQARKDRARGKADALDGHALLTREKVAAGVALLDGRTDITDDDWQLSAVIMAKSDETRSEVINKMVEKAQEQNKQRGRADAVRQQAAAEEADKAVLTRCSEGIIRCLEKRSGEWLSQNEVKKTLRSDLRKYFEEAVEHLSATRADFEAEEAKQGGAKYRLKGGK